MESSSSSDDSFLWSNASNDSIDSQNATVETMAMHCEESETGAINDHEKSKKSKKRKASESAQDGSNFIQPERKKIKLEPESDIDVSKKKKKAGKHVNKDNESPESILQSENYLNLRVKQEQISVLTSEETPKKKKKSKNLLPDIDKSSVFKESHVNEMESNLEVRIKEEQASLLVPGDKNKKKKKHKKSDSLIDTGHEPESAETDKIDAAGYLNMRVKQEQASTIEPEIPKSKKKKKHRNSLVTSDTDITSESKSELKFKDTLNSHNNDLDDQTNIEYSVIEEKFSAEETVVEEQRKKKNKKDKVKNNHELEDTEQGDITQAVENNSYNDTSLPAINFSCNNIASSTFINNSSVDIMEKQNQKSGDIKHSKHVSSSLKLSDRIMFEEDVNSSNVEVLSHKSSGKVSSFREANPQLKLYKTKSQGDCSITEDDEIWILRWPHEIDIKKLSNTNLTLEGKCKVKINGQTYDGFQNKDVNRITLVKYQNGAACVSNVPVEGCMDYRKRIPKVHIPDANNMVNNQTNFIPLPDTKCRHPLFGAHYKKAMKIPTAVADRLKAAKEQVTEAPCYFTKKKKHKKDKKNNIKIEIDSKAECEPSKKKRKRKHSEDNDAAPKKTKRIKHDPDSAVVWESEKAIEENLFNF